MPSMNDAADRSKLLSRRAALLAGGKVALLSALVARMYYLQVVEAEKYTTLAEDNRISLRLLAPPRGRIMDRNGIAMAVNEQNYRVLVIAEQTESLRATLDALSAIIPITDYERARIQREVRRRRSFVPITVKENLSWEDVARIEVNAPDLPGVAIDVGQSRHYPLLGLGAHILGYVASASEHDLATMAQDPLLELPGFRVGKAGVEKVYDLALRGKGGNSQVEVNSVGRVIRELAREDGDPGVDLHLTLDLKLQEYAAQRLGDESASAVVMDVNNGDLVVMASTPSFDPNAFNRGLSVDEWKELITNPRAPLTNKVIAGQYPPGSTYKMMTQIAAIEAGVTPDTRISCGGHVSLGNAKFHCWKKGGHGSVDMVGALKYSCDVYFYEIARRIGYERVAEVAKKFGLGRATGLDLPNERGGVIPNKDWKRAALKQPWHPGETLINAIGQGYVLTTPLQLALMTARIANGGKAVVPHVTRDLVTPAGISSRTGTDFPSIGVSAKGLEIARRGMFAVVNEPGGTALSSRIKDESMTMCGKTGSAQVRRITMRERETGVKKNDELPWKERDHALFVAFAPEPAPKYAIAVVVEHGGGGSAVAAPIARDIMVEVMKRDPQRARVADGAPGPPPPPRPKSDGRSG